MTIFGKIKYEGEKMKLYVNDKFAYEVFHYFNSFVEDGSYAAAAYFSIEDKYYLIQVGEKYDD